MSFLLSLWQIEDSSSLLTSRLLDTFELSFIRATRCCCSCRQNILFPFISDSNTNYLCLTQPVVFIVVHTTAAATTTSLIGANKGSEENKRLSFFPYFYANFSFPSFVIPFESFEGSLIQNSYLQCLIHHQCVNTMLVRFLSRPLSPRYYY